MADLVPTAPPIAVGDSGSIEGREFQVLGRLQLDHGRGPWDEWYLSFRNGVWGWLAHAQGRWYLSFERDATGLPPWEQLEPGSRQLLPATGNAPWTVAERGRSELVSAEGELPVRFTPREQGRYADLVAGTDGFATLDYGDGREPPKLFSGASLPSAALSLRAGGPRPAQRVDVQKLACPSCGAPVPILVPSETERCGCSFCGALLDFERGALALLKQLEPPKLRPMLALGSKGPLLGRERTVIGFMQRHVDIEGERFAWREYLLHSDAGYSWLVEDNRHWVHVAEVPASAVEDQYNWARFRGRKYRRFAKGQPCVDFVVGEFYWKVSVGDAAQTVDYIAPPRILSCERTSGEVSWSEGEYLEPATIAEAFGLRGRLPPRVGVGAAQPNPNDTERLKVPFALFMLLWFVLVGSYELFNKTHVFVDTTLEYPPSESAIAAGAARPAPTFTDPFEITSGPTTLQVQIESSLGNGWVSLGTSLLHEQTGQVDELDLLAEYYHGVSEGESWSEGSRSDTRYFGSLENGKYVLRLEPSWDPYGVPPGAAPSVRLRVVEGRRSFWCAGLSFVLLFLPLLLRGLLHASFEQARKENESL